MVYGGSLRIDVRVYKLPGMITNNQFEVDVRDVEYQRQAGRPWLARIYQPKGTGPFPTIIDVHGGAWHNGDRTNNTGIDQALAANGMVVAAIDFRQPPEAGYPASICDVNLAVRWPGNTTPPPFKADLSLEIVLRLLASQHAAAYLSDADLVTDDHSVYL